MVRALVFHQCGLGSNPGINTICELRLLLVLSFSLRGFSPGTPVFPSPQKPTVPNSNLTRNQIDKEPLCECAPSKSYLFIYLFTQEMRFTKIFTWIRILYDGKENGIRERDDRSSGCSVVMKKGQECSTTPLPPPSAVTYQN